MNAFNEEKFSAALKTHAATVLGVAPEAVPGDFISSILDLLTGFLSSCLGGKTMTSAEAAARVKNSNRVQQNNVKRQIRKQYARQGKSREEADQAFQTLLLAGTDTPADDLAKVIDDARADDAAVPEFDLN